MIKEVAFTQSQGCNIQWNDLPWKFEAGTPNMEGAVGLAEAVKYLEALGMEQVLCHEKELTKYAVERLKECSKVTCMAQPICQRNAASYLLASKIFHHMTLHSICDNYGIMIRSGYHCAQPLHQQVLKLQSSDRASFYIYNTKEEIDRFVEVIKEI